MTTYSFQPNGKWFVFVIETGETLQKDMNQTAARKTSWYINTGVRV